MKPLFSIIVPIYLVEKYLDKCISSVLDQQVDNYELILVDDGSPDACPNLCDEYSKKYSNIRVIHKKNEGLVAARKSGLKAAKGKYILSLDGDDYFKKDLLKTLTIIIENYNPDIISFDYDLVSETNEYIGVHHERLNEQLYYRSDIRDILQTAIYDNSENDHNTGCISYSLCFKAIKRSLLIKTQFNVPNQIRMGEDLAVVMPTIEKANSIYFLSFSGYCYRQRDDSMVKTFNYSEDKNIQKLIDFLNDNLTLINKKNINSYAVRMYLGQLIKAAKYIDKYDEFTSYANRLYDDYFIKCLKDFDQPNLMYKRKVRLWVTRKKMWFLFRLVYKK